MIKNSNFFLKKIIIVIFVSTAIIPSQQTIALPSLKKIIMNRINNFHTVEKGKFYRCKQLSAKTLAKYIDSYAIKTIINLRGENDADWWQQEKEVAEIMGVELYNIPMSAKRLPLKEEIAFILEIFDNASNPILVHCHSGADRTGLVSALWAFDKQYRSKKNAKKQLSLLYGHVKYQYPLLDKFVDMWEGRDWFFNSYNPT